MSVLGWLTEATFFSASPSLFSAVPSTPPQAAIRVDRPPMARPVEPARPTNLRRDRRSELKNSSSARSRRGSSGMRGLLGDDEGVLWHPGELDLAARPEGRGLGSVRVLGDDGQLLAARRADHVLDRDAQERGHDDRAAQDVRAVRALPARRDERDLLG